MKICSLLLSVLLLATPFSASDGSDISVRTLAAYIEGTGEKLDLASMTAVGAVIVNRCSTDRFPDSVTSNGAALGIIPSPSPSEMAIYAARLAASGFDPTGGAVYMFSRSESSAPQNRDKHVVYAAGDLCFATG